jgi:hypothetical protein
MKLKLLPIQLAALFVTVVVIGGVVSGCDSKTAKAAEQAATAAAQNWLTEIDSGQYAQSWQDSSTFFQGAVSQQKWESELTAVRKPLGDLESRNLEFAQYATQLIGVPDGQYVVMRFKASFANKKSAVETVTFMLETNGQWKPGGYFIK